MPLLTIMQEKGNSLVARVRTIWKYRRQLQAMAAAAAIFTAGGMKMAWNIYETPTGHPTLTNARTHLLIIFWFVGVILGALIAATFVQRVTKNVAYCSSGVLLISGGILSISLPIYFYALVASNILEGSAYGLTLVQAFITAGEVTQNSVRGLVASIERIALWFGICQQLIYTRLWYTVAPSGNESFLHMHINQPHGIIIALLGLAAIFFTLKFRIESPLLLQMRQRDLTATYTLNRLHGTRYPTSDVLRMRDDCKKLLSIDNDSSVLQTFRRSNAEPFLKVMILRCFTALTLTLPFNRAFLTATWHGLGCEMNCVFIMPAYALLGSIVGSLLVDHCGRRKMSVYSLLFGGMFIFLAAAILEEHSETGPNLIVELEFTAYLMVLCQFVICSGVSIATTAYMTEAFTTTVKGKCIAAIVVLEQLLHIGLMLAVFQGDFNYIGFFFTIGSVSLLLGVLVFLIMPETKRLMLSECLMTFAQVSP